MNDNECLPGFFIGGPLDGCIVPDWALNLNSFKASAKLEDTKPIYSGLNNRVMGMACTGQVPSVIYRRMVFAIRRTGLSYAFQVHGLEEAEAEQRASKLLGI